MRSAEGGVEFSHRPKEVGDDAAVTQAELFQAMVGGCFDDVDVEFAVG